MTLINPTDPPERQTAKLLRIAEALMHRVEQSPNRSSHAYAQFERAARLESEVRQRTEDLGRTLDLLHESNARLAESTREAQAARSYLAEAIETVEEGFALFDAQDRLVLNNSRFCTDLTDVLPQLKPGLTFTEYVDLVSQSSALELPQGDTPSEWRARRLKRHADSHTTFNVRLAFDRWIQVSEHRTASEGTVILQTDVTRIIRTERRERERLIDRQARMVRATLDHLEQGVCTFDREGRLVGWNDQIEAILARPLGGHVLGLHIDDLLDRLDDMFLFTGSVSRAELKAWAARHGHRRDLQFEVAQPTGPDAQRVYTVSAQQMPEEGFVVSFTDITAERESARALRELNETLERRVAARTDELGAALDEAQRANASKTRFMAAASHDLLQPLSAAKLFVSAIEDRADSDEVRDVAEKAISALASVETIIEALLDISKLDAARITLNIETTPLATILDSLALEMTPLAAAKGITLTFVPTSLRVRSDPVLLRRMVQNLVANAIRHTDGDRVLVGIRRANGAAQLQVCDCGPGIAVQDQAAIFQEFHQLVPHRSGANGLGLGLAIVERAAAMLDHDLTLRSELGRGSQFCISLPIVSGENAEKTPRPKPEILGRTALDGQVVLLVENDLEVARGITLMVEGWGADLIHAADGTSALDLLEDLGIMPDAFLIDYQLEADMDGLGLVQALRSRFGDIPVRLISADRSQTLRQACKDADVTLISKPLAADQVMSFLVDLAP
ncbi:MAG: PAS-domain containing protein [Pseudomonadota bacterium]